MEVFWYLPTQGDERQFGNDAGRREPHFGYLKQIAEAVDELGYAGMLVGTGTKQDSWIVSSALISATRRLKFLIATRPSILSPTLMARMAATFDQISEGRLLLNIVAGASSHQLRGDGVFLDHDQRYAETDEYLHIWRSLFTQDEVNFKGNHLQVEHGKLDFPPVQLPYPPLYFGGSSSAALEVAANHIDVYLTWGEPLEMVAEKIEVVRALARGRGRTPRFGIRFQVIVRETEAEAWIAAAKLIENIDETTMRKNARSFAASESVGQQRMTALHEGDPRKLVVGPNLWAGVGLARPGAGTALVGTPHQVADRMKEFAALGIDTFVLSGFPHLEEAYLFGELVFPLLPLSNRPPVRASLLETTSRQMVPLSGGEAT